VEARENMELEMGEYENFDDFLEMIITFGYITLFAGKEGFLTQSCLFCSCFPTGFGYIDGLHLV
jgi:hypothetical protein